MSTSRYEYPPAGAALERRSAAPLRDARPWLLGLSAAVILLDRISKQLVTDHLLPGRAHTLVPGVLRITHVLNTGAAFSVFADSTSPEAVRYGLIAFSLVAAMVVAVLLWRSGRALSLSGFALALILGGALGNLYDRVHLHFVVDFIEVHIVHYHWPDFNLADSAIVIGAFLLVAEIFRPQPHASDQAA